MPQPGLELATTKNSPMTYRKFQASEKFRPTSAQADVGRYFSKIHSAPFQQSTAQIDKCWIAVVTIQLSLPFWYPTMFYLRHRFFF